MVLCLAVRGTTFLQQLFCRGVFPAYRETVVVCVGCQLVPEGLDAIVAQRWVIEEGRVGEVEPHIHHSHHHSFSCEGTMLWRLLVGRQCFNHLRNRVHGQLCRGTGFYALHLRQLRQCFQLTDGYRDDADVSQPCIHLTTIFAELLLRHGIRSPDKRRYKTLLPSGGAGGGPPIPNPIPHPCRQLPVACLLC